MPLSQLQSAYTAAAATTTSTPPPTGVPTPPKSPPSNTSTIETPPQPQQTYTDTPYLSLQSKAFADWRDVSLRRRNLLLTPDATDCGKQLYLGEFDISHDAA
nr:hypothetical protein [Tanacetum cinerariifolium]